MKTDSVDLLFQSTSRDSDSLIRYGGYTSEYDYDPSQPCWKHPKIKENWKMVLAATALLVIGICKFLLTNFKFKRAVKLTIKSGICWKLILICSYSIPKN